MKFFKERELKDRAHYTKITADFVLDLYEKTKKMKSGEREAFLIELQELSQHLNDYILKPSATKKS